MYPCPSHTSTPLLHLSGKHEWLSRGEGSPDGRCSEVCRPAWHRVIRNQCKRKHQRQRGERVYNDMSWKCVCMLRVCTPGNTHVWKLEATVFQLIADFYLLPSPPPSFSFHFLPTLSLPVSSFSFIPSFLFPFASFVCLPLFTPSLPPPLPRCFMKSHGLSCKQRVRAQ